MPGVFLKAEWRKLAMANYAIDSQVLTPYVPIGTELDVWNNTCYVSLVGFMFLNTKVLGLPIPFHRNFEEVNLRFYVRYNAGGEYKRGVVFIKEIVPRAALTWVANTVYKEKYETMKMDHVWEVSDNQLLVRYRWRKGSWNCFEAKARPNAVDIATGSEEEFITEHFWGYTQQSSNSTSEYGVEHPRWKVYPVNSHNIDVDFGLVYGKEFSFLSNEKPVSVFLAEGSEIMVRNGTVLRTKL